MRPQATQKSRKPTWSELGSAAVDAGDLAKAEQCFSEAIRTDRRNGRHHFHLALVQEARGKYGPATEHLTQALRLDPRDGDAARRLTVLIGRRPLPPDVAPDPEGLRAALRHDSSASWLIAKLALHSLGKGSLAQAFAAGRRGEWDEAARALCVARTGEALKDELFLEMLRSTVARDLELEHLLTSLRRVLLLEVAPERFQDRHLQRLAIALMQQCRANEHIWHVTQAEEARLAEQACSLPALLAGDAEEGRKCLLVLLYKGVAELFGKDMAPEALAKVRPKALREALQACLAEDADLRARARAMQRLGQIADDVSRKVAAQYERSPYPRWTSLRKPSEGEERKRLASCFKPDELAFMDQPYKVLIAGCGTGHQAVYGALNSTNAHVTAIDLSASALAYASRMAERYGAKNVTFAQADVLALPGLPGFAGQFQIIECLGVLHHMADPFAGWRALIECLAPGGKMLVGLYSAIARRVITELKADPAFPGSGCDEAALRKFRRILMERAPTEVGGQLKLGPDFYSASEFRDMTCHVSEQHMTVAQIRGFLDSSGLRFRGFWLDPQFLDLFHKVYPAEAWPGRLELWEELEAAHPHLFGAMYNLWCDRA